MGVITGGDRPDGLGLGSIQPAITSGVKLRQALVVGGLVGPRSAATLLPSASPRLRG